MKKVGTSSIVSSPDAKPYRSPGAILQEADSKGVKPNFDTEPEQAVDAPVPVRREPVLLAPPETSTYTPPAPVAQRVQPVVNEDSERLKKENELLKAELEEIKKAIIIPQLREKYLGAVGNVKNFYYIVVEITGLTEADCYVFSKDTFNRRVVQIENWDNFNKAGDQVKQAKDLLGVLLKNIPNITSKFLN